MVQKKTPTFSTRGQTATQKRLTVYPLVQSHVNGHSAYQTLDAALAAKTVKISEVSEGGRVPDLQLTNSGKLPVLIIDGEEMVGAKQNRVINLTVLVAAGTKVIIPVSCVEAGRWRYSSSDFCASPQAMYASGRSAKMAGVTDSMRIRKSYRSDQGAVWNDIAHKMSRMEARSPSSEMKAIFERLLTSPSRTSRYAGRNLPRLPRTLQSSGRP